MVKVQKEFFLKFLKRGNTMNVAVIIAAGSGQRMGQAIPKQFLNLQGKNTIWIQTIQTP